MLCVLPLCSTITSPSLISLIHALDRISTPSALSLFSAVLTRLSPKTGRMCGERPIQVTFGTSRGIPQMRQSSSSCVASSAVNSIPVKPVPHTIICKSLGFFVWTYSLNLFSIFLSNLIAAFKDESV